MSKVNSCQNNYNKCFVLSALYLLTLYLNIKIKFGRQQIVFHSFIETEGKQLKRNLIVNCDGFNYANCSLTLSTFFLFSFQNLSTLISIK